MVEFEVFRFLVDLSFNVLVTDAWNSEFAPVVERGWVLILDEIVEGWKVFDRGSTNRPVVNVVEQIDALSVS